MKLLTFSVDTVLGPMRRLGLLLPGNQAILDLNAAYHWHLADRGQSKAYDIAQTLMPPDMVQWLELGPLGMNMARELLDQINEILGDSQQIAALPKAPNGAHLAFALDAVLVHPPVSSPPAYKDFYTFETHVSNSFHRRGESVPNEWYEMPVYYKGNPHSFIDPGSAVPWPSYTKRFDYELEIACVIGKQGKNIAVEQAGEYIAGYTILNDFSARDIQKKEMICRLGPAKVKDFATGLGPFLVTPDEIPDIRNLTMVAHINGKEVTRGNTGTSHFTFEQMIAHASLDETIYAGEVFGSGTVGNGCALEHDRWLKPGDTIELEIEHLGVLIHTIGQPTS